MKTKNLVNSYLKIVILASFCISTGCVGLPPIEWSNKLPSEFERRVQVEDWRHRHNEKLAKARANSPEMFDRMDNSISDEDAVIEVYDSQGNKIGTAIGR